MFPFPFSLTSLFLFFLLLMRYSLGSLGLLFLSFFPSPLSSFLKKRKLFEKRFGVRKGQEVYSDIWFHVSSEGEWEEIIPLVHYFLEKTQKRVTIWFTSESLENKVTKILSSSPKRLQILCFCLLEINPFGQRSLLSFSPPQIFFMVRYDFFPELMAQGWRATSFILLSATLKAKKKALQKKGARRLLRIFPYGAFDSIYAATEREAFLFKELSLKASLESFNFRHTQIMRRQREGNHLQKTPGFDFFSKKIEKFPVSRRMILGNFWFHERDLLTTPLLKALKKGESFLFVAPHKLSGPEYEKVKRFLEGKCSDFGLELTLWEEEGLQGKGPLVLCQRPGLLCEIYPLFGHCYVGGGFGRSIHSILEPFWGGGRIYCGPRTYRSTEFDFAQEFYGAQKIKGLRVVKELSDFYSLVEESGQDKEEESEISRAIQDLGENIFAQEEMILKNFSELLKS